MKIELPRLLLFGLLIACSAPAAAQVPEPAPAPTADAPPAEAAPAARSSTRAGPRRARMQIQPYLEVAQVVSADLNGGDTLTYTSVAAGIDGRIVRRRVSVVASYRYQRNIEWNGNLPEQDSHSGLVAVNATVIPGALQVEAGGIATRTGGDGRAVGVTDRDSAVEVYGVYAGPTLSARAGDVALNASYRLGYVAVDDDNAQNLPGDDFQSATTQSATASAGMGPGRLPFGWTVGAGYGRTDTEGEFDPEFEAAYVRGDVVVPVSPSLALTAGVGYENIEASQLDVIRDGAGNPVPGLSLADRNAPRVLTYDLAGVIYDGGLIWRPSARTELQARAGHRYGGTTFTGSLSHRLSERAGLTAVVYDTVETFSGILINDLSNLPEGFEAVRDPVTGTLNGCALGTTPGQGACLDRSLQSIRGNAFRMRGGSLVLSGTRGLYSWGVGGGYSTRRYGDGRVPGNPNVLVAGSSDESFGLFGSLGRRLSRTSSVNLNTFANWFDSDIQGSDRIFSTGITAGYGRSFLFDRLRLNASFGLYHNEGGGQENTIASGALGLRYSFNR